MRMRKPPRMTIANQRRCGSFFFSWSKMSIRTEWLFSISASSYFAVGTKAALGDAAIAEGTVEQSEELEKNGSRDGAPEGHHQQLPQSSPAKERGAPAGEQKKQGDNRSDGAGRQAEGELRKELMAQDQIPIEKNGQANQEKRQHTHS